MMNRRGQWRREPNVCEWPGGTGFELRSETTKQGKARTKEGLGRLFPTGISPSPRTGQDCLEKQWDTRGVST